MKLGSRSYLCLTEVGEVFNWSGCGKMLLAHRILFAVALGLVLAACVSTSRYNRAVTALDAQWKEENDKTLDAGRRTTQATKLDAFAAVQRTAQRLSMVVEEQDYPTGFLFVSSAAPTPLTREEWAEVQKLDTSKMRRIIAKEVGPASWLATLDPSGKDVLMNVFVTQKDDGVEISFAMRLRNNKAGTDRVRRMQPPPTAVRLGVGKFWAVFNEELAKVKTPDREIPKLSDEKPTNGPREPLRPSQKVRENPDGVAVIISNKDYAGHVPDVDFAHNDAKAMRRFIVEVLGFREGNIIELRDATQTDISAVLGNETSIRGKLWRWVRPRESDVVVFYSGHGVPGPRDGRRYLLPVNADPDAPEIGGFALDTLYKNLAQLDARSVTVFLDSCFSGDSAAGPLLKRSGLNVTRKLPETELTVLTAAQGNEVASWDEEARQGLFTRYLLEALYGEADKDRYGNGDGKITLKEAKRYLDHEMTYNARRRYGRDQNASIKGNLDSVLASYSREISSN